MGYTTFSKTITMESNTVSYTHLDVYKRQGVVAMIASTRPLVGKGYLYPLIPFNGKALRRLLVREPINRDNT